MHRKRNVKVLSHLFKCTGKVGKIDGKKRPYDTDQEQCQD